VPKLAQKVAAETIRETINFYTEFADAITAGRSATILLTICEGLQFITGPIAAETIVTTIDFIFSEGMVTNGIAAGSLAEGGLHKAFFT
jgi:hypothetical protein